MQKYYDHKSIESRWQEQWQKEKVFEAQEDKKKKKYYSLCMFPYPSGDGLHVGHPESYTAVDIVARFKRMQGYNVLNPMGWDAFGLPAENYAIKQGVPPWKTTADNIKTFARQITSLGFSYDWSREINTSDSSYYKWTQWMFLQMYKAGLAYKKKAKVNWCPSCQTVLANEQVIDGRCERCKSEVVQKDLKQWFFRVTAYAEELLDDLDKLAWPEAIKAAQRNWIGRSEGALLEFKIQDSRFKIQVFTTRPDTLYGATYVVLAPEHRLVQEFKSSISNWREVEDYIKKARTKSELQRTDLAKEKTGVELKGVKAVNPASGKEIPIFVADYVVMSYGTGAIMAVPAHDTRDFEFAKDYHVPIERVIDPISDDNLYNNFFSFGIDCPGIEGESADAHRKRMIEKMKEMLKKKEACYSSSGKMINSGEFDGMDSEEAKEKIVKKVGGQMRTQYRLRDWLISRQRYWGAPIPIVYCDTCGAVPVPEKDLPVLLPRDIDFKPTGESPLARSKEFHSVKCPKCGAAGKGVRRESDTMDTFVDSSWYFLRYCDPRNDKEPFGKEKVKYWMPVDLYIGGAEHAVLHLLYARFFIKALRDMGYLGIGEPFLKLRNQGMILGEDGQKMSKSRGNVINPDRVIEEFGADTMRLYEMFMGPLEDAKPWSTRGIMGTRRFLEKVWLLMVEWLESGQPGPVSEILERQLHKTIKKVTEDIERFKFNTAISAMMIMVNSMAKEKKFDRALWEKFLLILSPFAPHVAEELWQAMGNSDLICIQEWPSWDDDKVREEVVEMVVQVNGKMRAKVHVPADSSEEEVVARAVENDRIVAWTKGKKIVKKIYVPGKLVNIVVR